MTSPFVSVERVADADLAFAFEDEEHLFVDAVALYAAARGLLPRGVAPGDRIVEKADTHG